MHWVLLRLALVHSPLLKTMLVGGITNSFFRPNIMRTVRFWIRLLNTSRCWSSTVKTLRGCRQAGNPDIWHVDCTKPGMDHWKMFWCCTGLAIKLIQTSPKKGVQALLEKVFTQGNVQSGWSHTASTETFDLPILDDRKVEFFLPCNLKVWWLWWPKSLSFLTTYIYFLIKHYIQGVLKVHLKNIPASKELPFWNQAAVVSTAEIFTLSACTTAGTGGAT